MKIELNNFFARHSESETQKRELAAQFLASGQIPTPLEIKEIINRSIGTERTLLLSNHKFFKECNLRRGFDALVASANAAYTDLLKLEVTIAVHSSNVEDDGLMDYVVTDPIQKEVIAFCAAVYGIVDVTRRIKSARPDFVQELNKLHTDLIAEKKPDFIFDLRRNLSHGSVVIPSWTVTTDRNGSRGSIDMSVAILLKEGKWNADTISYFKLQNDGQIDLKLEIEQYLRALTRYADKVRSLFFSAPSAEEQDYYEIVDSFNRRNRTQFLRILLGQFKNMNDPANHLRRYFTDEQVRSIKRLPLGSRDQVDLMIAIKSVEYEIDAELKNEIYGLFAQLELRSQASP